MMEYTDKYWKMVIPYVKKSVTKRYGKEYTTALMKKTYTEYKDMLCRIDDVGKDNPMASNIYECLVFLALWKVADGRISIDELREISVDVLSMPVLKLMGLLVNGNKASGVQRVRKMMEKDAEWLEQYPQ